MRFLITRPEVDAGPLAVELAGRGHDPLIVPLMTIEPVAEAKWSLDDVQALLLTSANGVRSFAEREPDRSVTVYAVGDATARAAKDLGYKAVISAAGDVDDLFDLVQKELKPARGKLLHVGGVTVKGALVERLQKAGYQAERVALYQARKATDLPDEIKAALAEDQEQGIVFYSPRTAKTFVELVQKAYLGNNCQKLHAYCLSQAVQEALAPLTLKTVSVADKPEQEALLKMVGDAKKDPGQSNKPGDKPKVEDKKPEAKAADQSTVPTAGSKGPEPKKPEPAKADPKKPEPKAANTTATPAAPKKKGGGLGIAAAAVVLAFAGGVALWPLILPQVEPYLPADALPPQYRSQSAQPTVDLAALQQRIVVLEAAQRAANTKLSNLPEPTAFDATALEQQITALTERLQTVETALPDQAAKLDDDSLDGIRTRLNAIELGLRGMKSEAAGLLALQSTVNELSKTLDAQKAEMTALRALGEEARKITEGEARPAALMLAVGRLHNRLVAGGRFDKELRAVVALSQGDQDLAEMVATLKGHALVGVPTLRTLIEAYPAVADKVVRADVSAATDSGWLKDTLDRVSSVVTVRRTGEFTGKEPAALTARADKALQGGDLKEAVALLSQLEGPALEAAQPWLTKAQGRLAADAAIDVIEGRAIAILGDAQPGQ